MTKGFLLKMTKKPFRYLSPHQNKMRRKKKMTTMLKAKTMKKKNNMSKEPTRSRVVRQNIFSYNP